MGRAPCCDKDGLKRGPWTAEEDQKLVDHINKHGYGNWRTLPANAGLQRCGKSCRLRWTNYLRPDIKRGKFSFEEEQTIIHLHSILGNKWSAIAGRLPGRTDNEIKNYWNTHIRKKLLRMGIDPVTHTPRLDLLDLSSIFQTPFYDASNLNLLRIWSQQYFPDSVLPYPNSNVQEPQMSLPPVQDVQIHGGPFPSTGPAQLLQPPSAESGLANCLLDDYFLLQNLGCYEPVDSEPLMDHPAPLDGSQNFNFQQAWSTPSPSQVNSSSTVTTSEDEREMSYCSNLLNFDVSNSHLFEVSELM
ncbi:unnamed protein product [Cuscuta epithymum]|uniref:Uncharacterized protein n=1 Tax=Cuscuta epithymum TaxID=186058 RepID=A0AAV0DB06_9ASTE|nr:unnamed protein product [Cuscuta epithymum]